jgi:GntR family transcriptional regulator, rspAB operon transcriptional repressor
VARQRVRIVPAQLERRVYERLLADITSGTLTPGAPLVEARLAQEFGVSKTPVREALIRLQRDGLVEIEPYRGARVAEPSQQDVEEILELRTCIESHIADDLARRRPRAATKALERSVERSRAALAAEDRDAFVRSLIEFDEAIARSCRNSRMVRVLGELRNALALIGTASMRAPGRQARSLAEHEAILKAIDAGDPEGAVAATRDHIRSIARDSLPTAAAQPSGPEPQAVAQ